MPKYKIKDLLNLIADILIEKKASNIVYVDFANIENALCNYFVICSGNSSTHVESLANNVEKIVQKEFNENCWSKEGIRNSQWIILDYLDIVVHIFQPLYRDILKLEELWADAQISHFDKKEIIRE